MRRALRAVALLGCFLGGAAAHAAEESELERLWSERYCHELNAPCEGLDVEHAEKRTLARALRALEETTALHPGGEIADFYGIVARAFGGIAFFHKKECERAMASVNFDSGVVTLCRSFFGAGVSDAERASTLVHEARHLQPGVEIHEICESGVYRRTRSCDSEFHGGLWRGSGYNADIVYLNWLQTNRRRNQLSVDVIQSEINAVLPERFNKIGVMETIQWRSGNGVPGMPR
jgi:hypothetical protein